MNLERVRILAVAPYVAVFARFTHTSASAALVEGYCSIVFDHVCGHNIYLAVRIGNLRGDDHRRRRLTRPRVHHDKAQYDFSIVHIPARPVH